MAFLEFDGALDEAPAGDNAPGFKPFDGKLDTRRGGTRAEGKPFVAGMEAPVTPTPSQPAAAEVPNNYAERGVGGVLADIRTSADMRGARMAPPVQVLERPATPEMLAAQPPGLTAQEMDEGSIAPWKLDQMRAAGEYVAPTRPAEAKPFSTAQNIAQDVREATTNPVARGAVAGFSNLGQTGVGLVRGAADMVGADEVSKFATDTSRTANAIGAGATQGLSGNNKLIADVTASIISSTPAMAIGTIGGPALRTLFAQTAAADYAETGDAAHAGIVGAAEALGERFGFPEQIKLLKGVVRGMPAGDVAKVFGAMIAKEIPGEQLTTALEFLGDKYGPGARTPGATFADYLQQAGDTLAVTIGQTAAMGGGPATVVQTRNAMGQADAAVNRSAMSMPERAAADKGFVRPTQQRKAIDESLDDFAATHGATPTAQKALEAMKAEGAKRPLSQVADYYRRAVAALSRRGLVNWPADDRSLEGIGKPPVKESGQSGSHETTEAGPAPDIADRLAGQFGIADEEPSNAQPDLAASPPVAAGAGAAGAPDADAGGGSSVSAEFNADQIKQRLPAMQKPKPVVRPARPAVQSAAAPAEPAPGLAVEGGQQPGAAAPIFTGKSALFDGYGASQGSTAEGTRRQLMVDPAGGYYWGDWRQESQRDVGAVAGGEHASGTPASFPTSADARTAAQQTPSDRRAPSIQQRAAVAPPRVIARAGRTPNSAEPIELRANPDGTLTPYMGGKAMLDFESGEPVVVPAGASDLDAKKAIREAGSVSNRTNFFPATKGAAPAPEPAAAPTGFVPAPDGYRVRVTQHEKGSNLLDPTSDIGAFTYEVKKGEDDANPLTMVLNKDGKLVTAKSVLDGNKSNGTAWVPPSVEAAEKVRALLAERAQTKVGSAERKAVDARIAEAVKLAAAPPAVAATPAPAPKPRRIAPVRGSNALGQISARLGGISPDLLADLSEKKQRTRTGKTGKKTQYTAWDNPLHQGHGPLFRKGGTADLTEVARVLEEEGYLEPGSVERDPIAASQRAQEIIRAELKQGGSALREGDPAAVEAEMQRRREMAQDDVPDDILAPLTDEDLAEAGYADAAPEVKEAVERLLADAEAAGIDTEALREDAAKATEGLTEDEYHARLQAALREALQTLPQDDQGAGGADSAAARGSDQGDGSAAGDQVGEEEGRLTKRQVLEKVAERLGVQVFKAAGGWHASGASIYIPDADVDSQGAVSNSHVFAHELAHTVMHKRGVSFARFPRREIERYIPNWGEFVAASKAFRPGVHNHENESYRRHAQKPDEIIADAIGSVLIGDKPLSMLKPLMEKVGLTERDLGLEPVEPTRPDLTLTSPTREKVIAQQEAIEREQADREAPADKPESKLTGEQVDAFNTQGSVFDQPAEAAAPSPAAEKPKAERPAAKGPATAQAAIDAFNADDSAQAMAIVAKLKLDDLKTVGGAIGYPVNFTETATAYRQRLAGVADRLTKTSREQVARERVLFDKLTNRASDFDRMKEHMERAERLGNAPDSTAFDTAYYPMDGGDSKWMKIPEALKLLAADVRSLKENPDYPKVSEMVRKARPAVFDAADAAPADAPQPQPEKAEKPVAPAPSVAGQKNMAYRGSRIASLMAMNEQIRKLDPTEAWHPDNITDATDLDALQDSISSTLVRLQREKAEKQAQEKIDDIGEKIGGARKDTAESGFTKTRRAADDEDRPAWARRFKIAQIVKAGGQIGSIKDEGRWVIRDSRSTDWTGQPRQVGRDTFATKEEAEAYVPIAAVSLKHKLSSTRDGKYEIWREVSDRKRVKVVDQQFDTREEAMAYMVKNAVQIIETNTTFGEADIPLPPDRARTGPQRRTGDVKGEDFAKTFGFRGVEFGNWNNQVERQALMNDAFDGLMDLAGVLGVPPKALGLNGDLALAFGARGHGLNSARAHYERDRAVINLTKERGAGSLAHEWFHALDHYFGRQDGKASAEWVVQKDGTRTLKAAERDEDYVSHGFRGDRSGVRPELREAYTNVIQTMTKKAEKYVEDTAKVDKFTASAKEDLAGRLDSLRRDLAEQKDVRYWKRNNAPASAEQLAEFDTIAKALLEGDASATATEWRTIGDLNQSASTRARIANRWTNDSLERLSAIYKQVRGRSGFDSQNQAGVMDKLRQAADRYSQRLKMLADAQSGTEKQRMVPTEFAMNARELDQGRGTDYWTTPHEMAARAFQGYVEDKIAEQGGVSRFLNYGPENIGIPTPWGVKRPFPAGAERVAINKAFDAFVGKIKTRETDRGTLLFSAAEPTPPFYSELSRQVERVNMNAGPAASWKAWLRGLPQKGVKPDEIAWTGIEEWLDIQQGKVTKQSVLGYLNANGVKVTETTLGVKYGPGELDSLLDQWAARNQGPTADAINSGETWNRTAAIAERNGDDEVVRMIRRDDESANFGPDTHPALTLPGATNYREVLLTLPEDSAAQKRKLEELDAEATRLEKAGDPRWREVSRERGELLRSQSANTYRSGHWDQPNILAHIRLNDRTDAEGKRVLFVEEIQSDYAQAARKGRNDRIKTIMKNEGITKQEAEKRVPEDAGFIGSMIPQNRQWKAVDTLEEGIETRSQAEAKMRELEPFLAKHAEPGVEDRLAIIERDDGFVVVQESRSAVAFAPAKMGVPRAPFVGKTDAWVALALKRVIKMAAAEGYDRVAFVTGEQSAERYDLSKQVRSIAWSGRGNDTEKRVTIAPNSGNDIEFIAQPDGRVGGMAGGSIGNEFDGKRLDEIVGKEVAERILGETHGDMRGNGLKVGGEGMKAFYDKIVPSVLRDVLRKVGGGQIGEVQIAKHEGIKFGDGSNAMLAQPGFDITPAMREKAFGGLPLFQADKPAGWSSIDGGGSEADTARYAADPDRNHLRIVDFARESIAERRPGFMLRAVEAPGSRSDLRAARAVARGIAGHKVIFVKQDNGRAFNGAAFESPGHDYLLIDVDSTQPVMAVAGHEVLHRLRAARPDLYDKLNARISAVLRNEGAYADRLRTKYAGLNLKPLSDEKIHEELLADVFGDEWSDPEFWRELGRDRPQGLRALAESVAKFLDDLVSKIIRLRPFGTEQYLTDLRAAREAVLDATREFQKGEVGDGGGMGDIAFSVDNHTPEQRDALARAGIRGKESIRDRIGAAFSKVADAIKTRGDLSHTFVQGSLDQFHGIRQAIKAELGNLPAEQDPYITARLANGGTSSVMRALLLHGRAQWSDNGQNLVKMDGTKGLLDTLAPLGADLNDFFGWMIGNRAARLKKEGRENNFTDDQIKALQGLSKGKEREFTKAALEYGAFKKALLDMAQSAGIVNAESRKAWDHADYIPFYRQIDEKSVFSPTGRKGLAGQSSGIRVLKGGESALNDPIENLLMNMSRLVDASLKNNAMLKTVDALKSSDVLTKVGYDMAGAVIPTSQVKKMLTAAGTPEAVLDAIPSEAFEGMAKMWAIQAPSDPDVVRVMRDGKPEFYRVNDPLLLKAMTSFVPFDFPGLGIARAFKRVLTATVTATPEFMARNFIRDSLAAHAIGRDGFNPAASIAGIAKSYTESGAGEDMLFAGASFQSGNISAADPTGTAVAVRRALRARGMDAASANRFIGTVLDTPAKLWEAYRHVGEAIENANREAIYEAAIKSGKSPTEAAYEAKDLMDFSLRGSSPAYQLLADVLPFFNARVQGLYRLGRADPKRLAVYGLLLTAASVALALANGDADWYDELPDWDKDTYWHFKIAGKHFRVPKPFELGVAFATIPERIMRYIKKQDAGSKTLGRLWANVRDQLAMDPVPQAIRPALNAWANKDTFRDQPIEGQADQGKLPSMRYSSQTSSAAKAAVGAAAPAADAIGLSPKKLEYLIGGYLGTAGLYALGLMDLAVDKIQGKPPGPTKRPDDIPLVRTFYRADPARATVYESDLYKMREEVEQVFKSIHALRGPNSTDADEAKAQSMEDENADKLGMRKTILNATKHLQSANKDRDAIMADTIMTPDEKRKALDDLQREKNQIAKEAVKDVQAAF